MTVLNMDCIEGMRLFPDAFFDSIVTDPPYELGFMGKTWDASGIANSVEMWREALRVLKPGGHLLAFSGSRTYHRMVCAIEDAGFEIRDQIMWVYGSGFPKSLDVSKAIDKAAGAEREVIGERKKLQSYGEGVNEVFGGGPDKGGVQQITAPATDAARQWQGWGTALKPAHEPIVVARKPLIGTVAANVQRFGTGAINVDGCRVESGGEHMVKGTVTKRTTVTGDERNGGAGSGMYAAGSSFTPTNHEGGRWPANLIHSGEPEVLAAFPQAPGQLAKASEADTPRNGQHIYGDLARGSNGSEPRVELDKSAARFFYCAKASKADRNEGLDAFTPATTSDGRAVAADNVYQCGKTERLNTHPTVKPTDLMRYLVRLVTPPGGIVLDPFTGSGSTGKACALERFGFIGFELSAEYCAIATARISRVRNAQ